MKRFVFSCIAVTLLVLAGAVTGVYGRFFSPGPRWSIDASPHSLTFELKTTPHSWDGSGLTGTTVSPPEWEGHPGWFVFADHANAWAFDGVDTLWLEEITPKSINGYKFAPRRGEVHPAYEHIPVRPPGGGPRPASGGNTGRDPEKFRACKGRCGDDEELNHPLHWIVLS